MKQFGPKDSLGVTIYFSSEFYIFSFEFSLLTCLIVSFLLFLDNEEDTWLGHMTNDIIGLDLDGQG